MELADFLDDFVDPEFKDRLRDTTSDRLAAVLTDAVAKSEARHSDTEVAKLAEERLLRDKGWHAMGAFDPAERSRVLDLLGVEGQLVFATFATARFVGNDEDRLYAGSSAQNKAMANFCSQDTRLFPVAFVPLVDPRRAVGARRRSDRGRMRRGDGSVDRRGTRAPTHPDLTGSGMCSVKPTCRSCCTSAVVEGSSTPPSTTTRCRSPTTWEVARTSDRRTSSGSPTRRRCSWEA